MAGGGQDRQEGIQVELKNESPAARPVVERS